MSEEINTPAIPALSVMLPLPILLTYCMANMGEFVIDKEAKTFTLSEPYVYSLDQLNDWEDLINQQILIYEEQLALINLEKPSIDLSAVTGKFEQISKNAATASFGCFIK